MGFHPDYDYWYENNGCICHLIFFGILAIGMIVLAMIGAR